MRSTGHERDCTGGRPYAIYPQSASGASGKRAICLGSI
jgi:hypothetical protein